MIDKIINLILDISIFVLLFLLAPLIAILMTIDGPVYAKAIGVLFMVLIVGAVVFAIKQSRRNRVRKEI